MGLYPPLKIGVSIPQPTCTSGAGIISPYQNLQKENPEKSFKTQSLHKTAPWVRCLDATLVGQKNIYTTVASLYLEHHLSRTSLYSILNLSHGLFVQAVTYFSLSISNKFSSHLRVRGRESQLYFNFYIHRYQNMQDNLGQIVKSRKIWKIW